MFKRRRFTQQVTLQDRLTAWAEEAREQAALLKPGADKDALLKKASQAEAASHLDGWLSSRELRPPK